MANDFNQQFSAALREAVIKWDRQLFRWRTIAAKCFLRRSVLQLDMNHQEYVKTTGILFSDEKDVGEITASILMKLHNMILHQTPHDIGMGGNEWSEALMLNEYAAEKFRAVADPLSQSIRKRFEIMKAVPGTKIIGEA